LFLLFLIFLVSEGLLFVSFFWTSFHSLSSLTLGISLGEGFYFSDPFELTFANTLLLSNAAICLGNRALVCKLWTQEPENFDEEVKSLGTAWCLMSKR